MTKTKQTSLGIFLHASSHFFVLSSSHRSVSSFTVQLVSRPPDKSKYTFILKQTTRPQAMDISNLEKKRGFKCYHLKLPSILSLHQRNPALAWDIFDGPNSRCLDARIR